MMKSEKMTEMQSSWDSFWNSFVRFLTKIVRNVFGHLNYNWIHTLHSVVYYLLIAILAFLLTREHQEKSFINTEIKVSQLEKNMVEALMVFAFFCI